eukprot:TRINITY_DN25375_c0_g1_i2.p1 TRINITY_DN25375_c0_g1~~TRINITY_DN25375_c0_g1_i2.p1  ORF type:complete len:121 (+),score=42.64 TRINITY_DN25375_c0_g1_i2:15-377(+)
MLRTRKLLAAVVSAHHPGYRAVTRQKSCLFDARMEVQRCNTEIARLMIIRDEIVKSELHVVRTANGRFTLNPMKRVRISQDVMDLKRRKDLLLQYIQRNEMINTMIDEREEGRCPFTCRA